MSTTTQRTHPTPDTKKRGLVASMFNRIAPRYDLLNRVVSFGQDVVWRKKLVNYLPAGEALEQLDLATGTGDIPIMMMATAKGKRIKHALGLDISSEMVRVGQEKLVKKNLGDRITLKEGDATDVSVSDNSKDLVTIAFGIRNVENVPQALTEMVRVLRPGGRALILEFSLPSFFLLRWGYLFYFRFILPIVGGLITGDYQALKYLNQSVEAFPYGEAFLSKMRDAGFKNVTGHNLCFGVATIYQGDV